MSNDIFVLCLILQGTNKKNKSPSVNAKGLEMSWLPRQDEFRNFFMREETVKVCHKLEKAIGVC